MQDFSFSCSILMRIMCYSGEKSCLLSQSCCYGFNDYKFIAIDMYFDFMVCVTDLGFCGE